MTKKCPWCGEKIQHPGLSSLGQYKCRCCGKKSRIKRNDLWLIVPAVFSLLVIILTRNIFALSSLLLVGVSLYYYLTIAPLERIQKKYVPVKSADAEAELIGEWPFFKKRTTFLDNRIFTVCFVNEDEEPVSGALAVSAGNIELDEDKLSFRLSFMPRCGQFTDFPKNTSFYMFEGKKRIAKGVITTNTGYPRLAPDELDF